jgi:hypothetical protein
LKEAPVNVEEAQDVVDQQIDSNRGWFGLRQDP